MGELGYAHCSHIFTVLLSFNHTPYLKTLNALEWGFAKSFLEFAKGKKNPKQKKFVLALVNCYRALLYSFSFLLTSPQSTLVLSVLPLSKNDGIRTGPYAATCSSSLAVGGVLGVSLSAKWRPIHIRSRSTTQRACLETCSESDRGIVCWGGANAATRRRA